MNISLTPELEALVKSKVESGLYHSASEVVREALRLLRERDLQQETRLRELRDRIENGIRQIENGHYVEFNSPEEFAERMKAEVRRRSAPEVPSG